MTTRTILGIVVAAVSVIAITVVLALALTGGSNASHMMPGDQMMNGSSHSMDR